MSDLENKFNRLNDAILACGVFAHADVVMGRLNELKREIEKTTEDVQIMVKALRLSKSGFEFVHNGILNATAYLDECNQALATETATKLLKS